MQRLMSGAILVRVLSYWYTWDWCPEGFIISVAIASSKSKANQKAVVSATSRSRQEIRQQLAASAGTKEGHSKGRTKRKDRGSLDVAGTCFPSMVILPSNVFVYSKWSHLRGVPLVEMHIMSQTTLPPLPASLCRPSNLLQPLRKMMTKNGQPASQLAESSLRPLDRSFLLLSVWKRRENNAWNILYTAGMDLIWIR